MVDISQFKDRINVERQKTTLACHDPRSEFLATLQAEGLTPPRTLRIGEIDRIQGVEDKAGKTSGWYSYAEIDDTQNDGSVIGIASYGDWKTGLNENWSSRSEMKMSGAEREKYMQQREAMRLQREKEIAERQEKAAVKAKAIYESAENANYHPYLEKKGIGVSEGLKIANDGRLIIPVKIDGEIVSLQFIDDNSNKLFLSGGKLKGGYFKIEGENDVTYIAEGYSTARSIFEATGKTTFICFNSGNIYEASSYIKNILPRSRIIIGGDDDFQNTNNTGRIKANQAAQGLGIETIFPTGFNDFNDMHQAIGTERLREFLQPTQTPNDMDRRSIDSKPRGMEQSGGILEEIANYYNATTGNEQRGFAYQTALAVGSLILGRSYKTNMENFTPLYLLNVGKSATGKEHGKRVIEKILYASGDDNLIAGDGYTSAGAVFTTLLDRPKHITVIDEFGRYLEAGRNMGNGSSNQREANTKIMEAISRTDGVIRPQSYSAMTKKKDEADAIKNRYVHNPSITIMAMTTPETLFNSLDMGAVKDGFFNRFVVSISDTQRAIREHMEPLDVPDSIVNWIKAVNERSGMSHVATEPATPIVLEFSTEAYELQRKFQQYTNVDLPNELEKYGMAELSGRSNEMAMKISLIVALSRDPHAKIIEVEDMKWAVQYVRKALDSTTSALKLKLSYSDFEADKKEIMADLRSRGNVGITKTEMNKTPPYSKHRAKDLKEILEALKEGELAYDVTEVPEGRGRPTVRWIATS